MKAKIDKFLQQQYRRLFEVEAEVDIADALLTDAQLYFVEDQLARIAQMPWPMSASYKRKREERKNKMAAYDHFTRMIDEGDWQSNVEAQNHLYDIYLAKTDRICSELLGEVDADIAPLAPLHYFSDIEVKVEDEKILMTENTSMRAQLINHIREKEQLIFEAQLAYMAAELAFSDNLFCFYARIEAVMSETDFNPTHSWMLRSEKRKAYMTKTIADKRIKDQKEVQDIQLALKRKLAEIYEGECEEKRIANSAKEPEAELELELELKAEAHAEVEVAAAKVAAEVAKVVAEAAKEAAAKAAAVKREKQIAKQVLAREKKNAEKLAKATAAKEKECAERLVAREDFGAWVLARGKDRAERILAEEKKIAEEAVAAEVAAAAVAVAVATKLAASKYAYEATWAIFKDSILFDLI